MLRCRAVTKRALFSLALVAGACGGETSDLPSTARGEDAGAAVGDAEGPSEGADGSAEANDAGVVRPTDAASASDASVLPSEPEEIDVEKKPQDHTTTLLFDPAKDQLNVTYHTFRIPSITTTKSGTVLAFAEGRQCAAVDYGNINVVFKRSTDDGKTWSKLGEVVGGGSGTWGNPTVVSDFVTGRVWLFLSWNADNRSQFGDKNPCTDAATQEVGVGERRVFSTYSDDDGKSWSKPADMTAALQPPKTAWDAIGPGTGIQTATGRLVVPAISRNIYSDDLGKTWKYATIPGGTSEGTIVELSDGTFQRNDRGVSLWVLEHRRWQSTGTIPGTFSAFKANPQLLDPRVEGSALRYSRVRHRILFLNPASTTERCEMRVRASYDDGATWPRSRPLHDNLTPAQTCQQDIGGYSSLAKTFDQHVGALSERSTTPGHFGIEFHRFNLSWLMNGVAEPK